MEKKTAEMTKSSEPVSIFLALLASGALGWWIHKYGVKSVMPKAFWNIGKGDALRKREHADWLRQVKGEKASIDRELKAILTGTFLAGGATAAGQSLWKNVIGKKPKRKLLSNIYMTSKRGSEEEESAVSSFGLRNPYYIPAIVLGGGLSYLGGYQLIDAVRDWWEKRKARMATEDAKKVFETAMRSGVDKQDRQTARSGFDAAFSKSKKAGFLSDLDELSELYEKTAQDKSERGFEKDHEPTVPGAPGKAYTMAHGPWVGPVTGVGLTAMLALLLGSWYVTYKGLQKYDPDKVLTEATKFRMMQQRRQLPRFYGVPHGTPKSITHELEHRPGKLTEEKIKKLLAVSK